MNNLFASQILWAEVPHICMCLFKKVYTILTSDNKYQLLSNIYQ